MSKIIVDPGVCGFPCEIEVRKEDSGEAVVRIQSECTQVSKLNDGLGSLELRDIFVSPNENVVFDLSRKAGCHATCPVPLAVLKCAEVEMGMALPRDVVIKFRVS
jgi:hypothetical protein